MPGGATWPDIPGDGWFAEEVQTIPFDGAPMPLVDNRAAIDKTLTTWNTANEWPRELPDPCGGASGGPESTSGPTGGPRGAAGRVPFGLTHRDWFRNRRGYHGFRVVVSASRVEP